MLPFFVFTAMAASCQIAAVAPLGVSRAEAPANYLAYPVTTDLQRTLLPPIKGVPASVYVMLNGNAILDEYGDLDPKLVNLARLKRDVVAYRGKEAGSILCDLASRCAGRPHGGSQGHCSHHRELTKELGFRFEPGLLAVIIRPRRSQQRLGNTVSAIRVGQTSNRMDQSQSETAGQGLSVRTVLSIPHR